MLSRIGLRTGVCVLLASPFVGAADETKVPDDLPEVKIRLQLIAIESAKLAAHYGTLVERELDLQGSVRACVKSGDQRLPQYQQALQEAQGDLETTKRKMIALCNALNGGLLPRGYSALVEQHASGVVLDVIALQGRPRSNRPSESTGGAVITATPPKLRYIIRAQQEISAARGNRITIRHPLGRVVCVIEIVSPGNKGSRSAVRAFVEKTIDFLRHGVHLLVVDLFPPSVRDPQGIHKAIWDEIEDQPFELPPDKPLTLAAYSGGACPEMFVQPVAVGQALPDMPLFLTPEVYINVPLETTYQAAWADVPSFGQDVLTGRSTEA